MSGLISVKKLVAAAMVTFSVAGGGAALAGDSKESAPAPQPGPFDKGCIKNEYTQSVYKDVLQTLAQSDDRDVSRFAAGLMVDERDKNNPGGCLKRYARSEEQYKNAITALLKAENPRVRTVGVALVAEEFLKRSNVFKTIEANERCLIERGKDPVSVSVAERLLSNFCAPRQ